MLVKATTWKRPCLAFIWYMHWKCHRHERMVKCYIKAGVYCSVRSLWGLYMKSKGLKTQIVCLLRKGSTISLTKCLPKVLYKVPEEKINQAIITFYHMQRSILRPPIKTAFSVIRLAPDRWLLRRALYPSWRLECSYKNLGIEVECPIFKARCISQNVNIVLRYPLLSQPLS